MSEYKVPLPTIEAFLHGHDDEKYIVNVQYVKSENKIYKVKEDPKTKKLYLQTDHFKPFMWARNVDFQQLKFYEGNSSKIAEYKRKFGVEVKKLKIADNDRVQNGFIYLYECSKSYDDLQNFLKYGGLSTSAKEYELIDNYNHRVISRVQTKTSGEATAHFYLTFGYDPEDASMTSRYSVNSVPLFISLKPEEQYLISTGKRLFKGYEDYNEVHKLVFDLETEGLNPDEDRIYLSGIKDNRGFEELIHADNDDESERQCIIRMFEIIDELKPAIIGTYNGADFDWPFIFKRCEVLGIEIKDIVKTLHPSFNVYNTNNRLKLGNETQDYTQTNIWGYSVIDISHSARRAQAIDSGMKKWNLKYVCQYNEVAKKNRVYVDGKKLAETWEKNEKFWFTDASGKYSKVKPELEFIDNLNEEHVLKDPNKVYIVGESDRLAKNTPKGSNVIVLNTLTDIKATKELKKYVIKQIEPVFNEVHRGKTVVFDKRGLNHGSDTNRPDVEKMFYSVLKIIRQRIQGYTEVDGRYLLRRYLMDDLWETNEVDEIYNQSSFLLAKLVPTTYQRVTTMGTAGLWQLLMLAWSYETNNAVPKPDIKRDFTGGLSRLLDVGYNEFLSKIDYSSLYPAIQLAHDVFPSVDVTGAMKSMLKYFHSERFKAKDLSSKYKKAGNKALASKYKRKQLPLKIFINSMYGALTAPQAFYWGEMDKGELVTCLGRQYLRLAVRYHMQLGFKPLVLDTDGINFRKPENIDEFTYTGRGYHERTEAGVKYTGIDAVIAKFNDLYMMGEMAVDLDGEWPSCINFKRKNYALKEYDGRISLTGNTIKSRGMPEYIEEFIDKGIKLLLDNKGQEFIEYYYDYVKRIVTYDIPLSKIASKSKVKETVDAYINRGTDKNGRQLAKKAHMELIMQNNMSPKLGTVIYYVNDGIGPSDGDVSEKFARDEKGKLIKYKVDEEGNFVYDEDGKPIVDKKGKKMVIGMNSYMLSNEIVEDQPEKRGKYNYKKYLKALNERLSGLLSPFHKDIRDKILLNYTVKAWDDQKNKYVNVTIDSAEKVDAHRGRFINDELKLCSGQPVDPKDQDSIDELFTPEPKEIKYWEKYHKGEPYDPRIWDNRNDLNFHVPKFNKHKEIKEITEYETV